jgi:pantoate--beta-alanine ligase
MQLRTVRTVAALRAAVAAARRSGHTIGLVPTMGSLHEGHLSLMRVAREQCGFVVMSLFVNPAQFSPGEDFDRYPRDERRDAELASACGVDLLFAPPLEEVYPDGFSTSVQVAGLTDVMCGAPGSRGRSHFTGVATVVAKLLNMCEPDVAFFGQKDFQQSLVIRRLVRDLNIPARIEVCPTVREPDGLALSSRNAYLDPEQRERAASLNRALGAAARATRDGAARAQVRDAALEVLGAAGVEPEYVEVRRADDLGAPRWQPGERLVVAIAAPVGPARLIDNTLIELPIPSERPADKVALVSD